MTTQARRPRRAASRAKAAETVVLPTPPDPQHTTMARSATSSRQADHGAGGRDDRGRRNRAHGVASSPVGVDDAVGASPGTARSGPRRRAAGARRRRASSARRSSRSGPMPALKRNGSLQLRRGSSAARRARCSSWSRTGGPGSRPPTAAPRPGRSRASRRRRPPPASGSRVEGGVGGETGVDDDRARARCRCGPPGRRRPRRPR